MAPQKALIELKAGNATFAEKTTASQRKELQRGQSPVAIVVACSDSRVSPELIFSESLGRLFVIRLAGNVLDDLAIASIEFGVEVLKIPLITIMGHEDCGAVKAAIEAQGTTVEGAMGKLVAAITPAVKMAEETAPKDPLNVAIQQNVRNMGVYLRQHSSVVDRAITEGRLEISLAEFHLATGEVEWLQ